jgi:hypothetical protein
MRLNIQAAVVNELVDEKLPPILSAESSVHQNFNLTDFLIQQTRTSPRVPSPRIIPND